MASFTVSNTSVLRNFYKDYRSYVTRSNRTEASSGTLSYADSMALHRAAKAINESDFSDKTKTQYQLQAFVDAYNYTAESSASSDDNDVVSAFKSIKKLTTDYADELEDVGIRIDSNGYLKLSSSATTNIGSSTFQSILGSDTDFMKNLSTYAKRLANRVDVYL